jgi:hypothetical protein
VEDKADNDAENEVPTLLETAQAAARIVLAFLSFNIWLTVRLLLGGAYLRAGLSSCNTRDALCKEVGACPKAGGGVACLVMGVVGTVVVGVVVGVVNDVIGGVNVVVLVVGGV